MCYARYRVICINQCRTEISAEAKLQRKQKTGKSAEMLREKKILAQIATSALLPLIFHPSIFRADGDRQDAETANGHHSGGKGWERAHSTPSSPAPRHKVINYPTLNHRRSTSRQSYSGTRQFLRRTKHGAVVDAVTGVD